MPRSGSPYPPAFRRRMVEPVRALGLLRRRISRPPSNPERCAPVRIPSVPALLALCLAAAPVQVSAFLSADAVRQYGAAGTLPPRPTASAQDAEEQSTRRMIAYLPRCGRGSHQALVRIGNPGSKTERATLTVYDDHGVQRAVVVVTVPPRASREASSCDLERGNPEQGITSTWSGTTNAPTLWARVDHPAVLGVTTYLRSGGFLTPMGRSAATKAAGGTGAARRHTATVPVFNAASDASGAPRSILRIVNHTDRARPVLLRAWDDAGDEGQEPIHCLVGAHRALTLYAKRLENGPKYAACRNERWGDGEGRWRVEVSDRRTRTDTLIAMSLLVSPETAQVANLSAAVPSTIASAPPVDYAPANSNVFFDRVRNRDVRVVGTDEIDDIFRFTTRQTGSTGGRYVVSGSVTGAGRWWYAKERTRHHATLTVRGDDGDSCRARLVFTGLTRGSYTSLCTGQDAGTYRGTFSF